MITVLFNGQEFEMQRATVRVNFAGILAKHSVSGVPLNDLNLTEATPEEKEKMRNEILEQLNPILERLGIAFMDSDSLDISTIERTE